MVFVVFILFQRGHGKHNKRVILGHSEFVRQAKMEQPPKVLGLSE